MKASEVFYIFYIQQRGDNQPKRLVVFYSKETLDPLIAYELGERINIPKAYKMLEYVQITLAQLSDFKKQFNNMGILQSKSKGIPDPEKEIS